VGKERGGRIDSKEKISILEAAVELFGSAVVLTTCELDPPGPQIAYVNDAFLRLTGYSRDELVGATPRILQGPATERTELDRLKINLRAGDAFEGCTWNVHKDGTAYRVQWTVTPLRFEGEAIDYFVSVQQDVTEGYQDLSRYTVASQTRSLVALLRAAWTDQEDSMTWALNYWGLLWELQRHISWIQTDAPVVGLVELQLRGLERVYEAHGIEATLQLLSDIGERFANTLEPSAFIARPHEHRFAIVIPMAIEAVDDADRHLFARTRALVAAVADNSFDIGGEAFHVEVSAGIARAPTDSRHAPELVVHAEAAAQAGTTTNADTIHWTDQSTIASRRHELTLKDSLRRAISAGELGVAYQPILDLRSNEVVGAEALVRWPQPDGHAPIGPEEFIPLAEELGLMDRITAQVFEQACHQLRRWQQCPGNEAIWVSVNVAPVQLGHPNLANELLAITQAAGVSPTNVKLEITESALDQGLDELGSVIDALVAAGFPLALDDFGKGHSSMARLIEMPFNVLKVDRTFVWQTPNGRGASVVASLSELSKQLELDVLGEGVETAAHEAFLRECNYAYAQGYYYAKPMAAADFEAWSGWLAE